MIAITIGVLFMRLVQISKNGFRSDLKCAVFVTVYTYSYSFVLSISGFFYS